MAIGSPMFRRDPVDLLTGFRRQETEAVKSYGGFCTFEPLGPFIISSRYNYGTFGTYVATNPLLLDILQHLVGCLGNGHSQSKLCLSNIWNPAALPL